MLSRACLAAASAHLGAGRVARTPDGGTFCRVKAFAKRPATHADFLAVPETMTAQLVDGELVATPRPAIDHTAAASALGGELGGPFQRGRGGPGGWWILDGTELHLGSDIVVPDLAGWRKSRLPVLPRQPYFTFAPDWVCEVLSASTAGLGRVKKLEVYRRERVGHVWFIDPVGKTLEVLRLDGAAWIVDTTYAGDDPVRAAPFDAVNLDLSALWLPDPPAEGP